MLGDVDYELTDGEINRRLRWNQHFDEYIEMMTEKCEEYNRKQLENKRKHSSEYQTYNDEL